MKSGELIREARKAGVKVLTRLNSNFVVVRFGAKFRKEDISSNIKPIRRAIEGKMYRIYSFKRCIWHGTAGNLFLVRGEGYDDFIPLFTTSLNTKPETAIMKYKERAPIEQTNKELKSYLGLEGGHFRTKESNYGHIFILCLVYNVIQYMRLYLTDMSFKDVLEGISVYLLRERPPKCAFSVRNAFKGVLGNIGCEKPNKINNKLTGTTLLSGALAA